MCLKIPMWLKLQKEICINIEWEEKRHWDLSSRYYPKKSKRKITQQKVKTKPFRNLKWNLGKVNSVNLSYVIIWKSQNLKK